MKADVGVFEEPSEGSVAVRSRISDAVGARVQEFFLDGGANLSEAEALTRSIIDLAETGFDVRNLVSDCEPLHYVSFRPSEITER